MKKGIALLFSICFLCIAFSTKSYTSDNNEIYSVVLPTMSVVDLVVDPQGIHGVMSHNDSFDNVEKYAGKISCTDIAMVTNLSSAPVKVTVNLQVTGDATAVKTREAVDGEDNNILLYAAPSAADTRGMEENYRLSSTGIVLAKEENIIEFLLPQAKYEIVENEDGSISKVLAEGETGHGMALSFGGYVSKEADWSSYVGKTPIKKIGMTAVFSFTSEIDEHETTGTQAYGMKEYAGDIIEIEEGSEYIPSEMDAILLATISVSENSIDGLSVSENSIEDETVSENGIEKDSESEDDIKKETVSGNGVEKETDSGNDNEDGTVSDNDIEKNTVSGNDLEKDNEVINNDVTNENEILTETSEKESTVSENNLKEDNEIQNPKEEEPSSTEGDSGDESSTVQETPEVSQSGETENTTDSEEELQTDFMDSQDSEIQNLTEEQSVPEENSLEEENVTQPEPENNTYVPENVVTEPNSVSENN